VTEQEKYETLEKFQESIGEKQSISFPEVERFIEETEGEICPEDIIDFLSANGITVIGFQREEHPRHLRKDDPLWLYIKEVGRVEILGKEREIKVATEMEEALHKIRDIIPANTMSIALLVRIGKMVKTRELPLDEFTKVTVGDPLATTDEKRVDALQILSKIEDNLEKIRELIRKNRTLKRTSKTNKEKLEKLHKTVKANVGQLELCSRALEMVKPLFNKIVDCVERLDDRLDNIAEAAKLDPDKLRKETDAILKGQTTSVKVAKKLKVTVSLINEATIQRKREHRIKKCLEETSLISLEELVELIEASEKEWETYEECKRLLVEANVRLVINIAKNYTNQGVEFLDLIQEGNTALIKAVERFDPRRGFKLGTYAIWWIRQAMLRTLAEQSHVVKLPTYLVQWIRRYARIAQELSQKLGREPTPFEVSEAIDVEPGRTSKMRRFFTSQVSLNKSLGDDDSRTLEDIIADESTTSPMNTANLTMLQSELKRVLETLTPKEQRVITLRFGLEDNMPRTLEEIGQIFDLSRERIRQIEMKALSKLRHPSKMEKLLPYFRE